MTAIGDRSWLGRVTASRANYWATFAFDPVAAGAFGWIGATSHRGPLLVGVLLVLGGFLSWTLIEYLLHRWVLHGMPVAARQHAKHHRDTQALVSTPLLCIPILATSIFAAIAFATSIGSAALVTFGLYAGYNYFVIVHHAQHFHPELLARSRFLQRNLRLHEVHHRHPETHYGISVGIWDKVFGTRSETSDER